jgi:UTP--glucose-1-phosphate uridylyltransferase
VTVNKAVIPGAGFGTRFLPATKALAKEMIPVVDKPGIQYAVEEAARAGITDILVVSSRGKSAIADHFGPHPELETLLEEAGKTEELAAVRHATSLAKLHYVYQKKASGLGHAVLEAKEHVGNEPFVVLLPDEIVPEPIDDEAALIPRLIELFEATDSNIVAVRRVPREDVPKYGVIAHEAIEGDHAKVTQLVEKPAVDEAPSDLSLPGRYLFKPEIFEAVERTKPGVGGEVQITDAIDLLARESSVLAYIHEGPIYDYGKKFEFLKTTIRLALRRDDLAKPLREFLAQIDLELGS